MGRPNDQRSSDQDNYVVFLQPKSVANAKANEEFGAFLRKQQQKQRWLLAAGVLMALFMAGLTATAIYTLIQSSCPNLHKELTTSSTDQDMYSPIYQQLDRHQLKHDFEVDVIEVVVDPELSLDLPFERPDSKQKTSGIQKQKQTVGASCSISEVGSRFDCMPGAVDLTEAECVDQGCCWDSSVPSIVPHCYYPSDFPSYKVTSNQPSGLGYSLKVSRDTPTKWPNEVKTLAVDVMYETDERLRLRVYDPATARYEVPLVVPNVDTPARNPAYQVKLPDPGMTFSIRVTRPGSQNLLFDTSRGAPLIFADQFIQLSTQLGSDYLFGLGEHRGTFLHSLNWTKLAFWTRDQPPEPNLNLYGDHPFFLGLDSQGSAYGVFLLNSNAMQVDLQPMPALTYRTIGGILDFYIFTGPKPDDVLRQYTDVIGRPTLPPYWGLGFHLCKFGYGSADELKKIIARNRASKIPYDTQWNDIDYARADLDWTYSKATYADLPDIVQDLHDNGQHYIMIVDPGISSTQPTGSYPPYDEGLQEELFVKKADGSGPLMGKVWPGPTAWPDFFHPSAQDWWYRQAQSYHSQIPFDGMWIDMNEPSNFVDGSVEGCPGNSSLDHPPWMPGVAQNSLMAKTVCPSAVQFVSSHYNLHNMYGFSEARASHRVLEKLRGERSVVITRSTFPGTGRYAGHWLGDNLSSWLDLYYSIPGILNFQLFGIPLVGADICGFRGITNPELCTRWMQLGAFYPFMRNHNAHTQDQDPGVFDKTTQDNMRPAVNARYNMLPYLYTLFFYSSMNGSSVARPLMFEFPSLQTYYIDKQFMWGDKLLISPVLTQGATSVYAYIPAGIWYDYYTGAEVRGQDTFVTLDAPIDMINLHIREGAIIPTQPPNVTTTLARKGKYGLLVALSDSGEADGELFVDDGVSLETIESGSYSFFTFSVRNNQLTSSVKQSKYHPDTGILLGRCRLMGLKSKPDTVMANGASVPFSFNATISVLNLENLSLDLMSSITIQW
ncbi:lysosomal alpha-glucosidase-like isoform X2 [Liolophura sinensis]|uniref:lysosomal alpha-glucosidase-like isoform X2 n=1 Tax=Liolophura sinensis TaxID=3198878 RepID=UPI003158A7EF